MLHQPFQFNHFSPSATTANSIASSSSLPCSSQVKTEMECVEAKALKTSLWTEMGLKSGQQVFTEELLGGNGGNCVFGDDSFVDDFLDFSKEEVADGYGKGEGQEEDDDVDEEEEEEEEEKDSVSVSSQDHNSNCSDFSVKGAFESVPGSELCVPADDLASLEWLSHFVEDSFSGFSSPFPAGNPPEKSQKNPNPNRFHPVSGISPLKISTFPTPVPAKARSKRSRTSGRVWSLGSASFSAETSSSSSSSLSSSSNSCLIFPNTSQNLDLFYYLGEEHPAKKQKKKNPLTEPLQNQRRCSHCGVQKTPQWRTGPLGAKTLCNACGVRFKSGRLLPEYRPALSPTFSSEVHSNNHRKVLEMRRKKETVPPGSGLAQAVSSF